jgi:hypothetical protein
MNSAKKKNAKSQASFQAAAADLASLAISRLFSV